VLRAACTFKVLSEVYATLASGDQVSTYWQKSKYYGDLFAKSKELAYLVIDSDGDGVTDIVLGSGNARLRRE
jgi:ureidoglycolate hydrolase